MHSSDWVGKWPEKVKHNDRSIGDLQWQKVKCHLKQVTVVTFVFTVLLLKKITPTVNNHNYIAFTM